MTCFFDSYIKYLKYTEYVSVLTVYPQRSDTEETCPPLLKHGVRYLIAVPFGMFLHSTEHNWPYSWVGKLLGILSSSSDSLLVGGGGAATDQSVI